MRGLTIVGRDCMGLNDWPHTVMMGRKNRLELILPRCSHFGIRLKEPGDGHMENDFNLWLATMDRLKVHIALVWTEGRQGPVEGIGQDRVVLLISILLYFYPGVYWCLFTDTSTLWGGFSSVNWGLTILDTSRPEVFPASGAVRCGKQSPYCSYVLVQASRQALTPSDLFHFLPPLNLKKNPVVFSNLLLILPTMIYKWTYLFTWTTLFYIALTLWYIIFY